MRRRRAGRRGASPRLARGRDGVRLAVRAGFEGWTVSVAGEIDAASVEAIEAALEEALGRSAAGVELDLTRASQADAAAVRMVARARAGAAARHLRLRVRPEAGARTAPAPAGAAEVRSRAARRPVCPGGRPRPRSPVAPVRRCFPL
jgi:anti-anti-sigma regulatory factor